MQQFVVPQFIDVEDKIFGPITTRQFLILLAAGLFIFLSYRFGDFSLFVTALVVIGGLAMIIAFAKINGQTFHYFMLNIVQTLRRPGLRIWQKAYSVEELKFFMRPEAAAPAPTLKKKNAAPKHMRDLALIVNTGGFYQPED